MAKDSLTVNMTVVGARETLAAFRRLPREASDSLRERSTQLAVALASHVAGAARGDSAQSALMAPTVKARRDRIPSIQAGGTTRVGSNRVPAYKILFGSEFGARTLAQYRPHVGRGSYWLFRAVEERETEIATAWELVVEDIRRSFERGGL